MFPDTDLNISLHKGFSLNTFADTISWPNPNTETLWAGTPHMRLRFEMHTNTLNTDQTWISHVMIYGTSCDTLYIHLALANIFY